MDEEEPSGGGEGGGLPGWVMTFADLMSLLMCFFVLLLSFSEMDVQKFKMMAGSMKMAFGVQRKVNVTGIPMGTSVIAQEFSPGKPSPTIIDTVRQQTMDDMKQNLKVDAAGQDGTQDVQDAKKVYEELKKSEIEKEAQKIKDALSKQIDEGLLEVIAKSDEVMIRIREKGSFPSGNAELQVSFYPVMKEIGAVLNELEGRIVVAGHTDDVPISTVQYPSNWILSAARAATVVHYLTKYGKVAHDRLEIRAHAEFLPLLENTTAENRAKNRRVEINVIFDDDKFLKEIPDDLRELSNAIPAPSPE